MKTRISYSTDNAETLEAAIHFWKVMVSKCQAELKQAEEELPKPYRERLAFVEGRLKNVQDRLIRLLQQPAVTRRSKRSA